MTNTLLRTRLWTAAGFLCLVLAWWLASLIAHPTIVASPVSTMQALVTFLSDPAFFGTVIYPSIGHILAGLCLAAVLGLGFGILAGQYIVVRSFLAPLRIVLTSMPAAIGVVLLILWMGLGSQMIIAVVGVFVAPVYYLALCEGFDSIDRDLSEMTRFYRVHPALRLRHLILPSLAPSLLPAHRLAIANSTRLTILAEILSASSGLGEAIDRSRTYLQTDRLFALMIIVLGLVLCIEGLSGFIANRFMRRAERR
ncbi:MAG: ABC transporter permease subunit [Pseudomonadota bacterium]